MFMFLNFLEIPCYFVLCTRIERTYENYFDNRLCALITDSHVIIKGY